MTRPPPISPLFPTRRSSDLEPTMARSTLLKARCSTSLTPTRPIRATNPRPRSEEHTSELQSHSDLVCRLLLEKKKKKPKTKNRPKQVVQCYLNLQYTKF